MVWEEKFVNKYQVPALQAVGWEGIFGFVTLSLLLVPMYYLRVGPPFSSNPRMVLEDALDGFTQARFHQYASLIIFKLIIVFNAKQMGNNPIIMLAMSGNY